MEEFRSLDTEVLVVSQTRREILALFPREPSLPFPVAPDPQRIVYRDFGLESTSWFVMVRPGVLLRYFRHLCRGWLPRPVREGEDVLQLGGDFVLDRNHRLAHAYRSTDPTDRPSVESLLKVVRKLANQAISPKTGPG